MINQPYVYQDDVFGSSSQDGLSDTIQSFFFSPAKPTSDGWIIGMGPALLLPTATDDLLGTEKWGAGPTFVALKQTGPWTYGALTNHLWSFAGEDTRSDVNLTFFQPFTTYALGQGQNLTLQSEITYNWDQEQWNVPINLIYSKVFKIGDQMMSFNTGARYFAEGPNGGPEWGLRLGIVFLFPK